MGDLPQALGPRSPHGFDLGSELPGAALGPGLHRLHRCHISLRSLAERSGPVRVAPSPGPALMLDLTLSTREFVAGDTFTIADIAHFGWLWRRAFAEVDISSLPHLSRWLAATEARPAVQRAIARVEAPIPAA